MFVPSKAESPNPVQVEEMQRVFRFIVDEEAPPATDADGRVAAYLAAAHRLKKVISGA